MNRPDPKQNLKEDLKNVKENLNSMKDHTKDMMKDKMKQNAEGLKQNAKYFKDNIKDTIKKPKIEIPPIPKTYMSPGALGLVAAGLAGAYYFLYYRKRQTNITTEPKTMTVPPGTTVKVQPKK